MTPINVLIHLHAGYGLGDAVQVSAVLRHVVAARPHWRIDYQAEEGKHQVGASIVANTFAYGHQPTSKQYDAEVQIVLYDTWANWRDRPNTRVSSCLHERFGLRWDAAYGRYQVNVPQDIVSEVKWRWSTFMPTPSSKPYVALHYKGNSSPERKDLSDSQADIICDHILGLGATPLLLDWRNVSPLSTRSGVGTTGKAEWSRTWGRNAAYNCAVISQCRAFIGIDSGPSKCASATDTPSLVIWTGHHPAPFHDPAENTTHLVPQGYHNLFPVCNDPGVISWFEAHHNLRHYISDPCSEVKTWLSGVLQ